MKKNIILFFLIVSFIFYGCAVLKIQKKTDKIIVSIVGDIMGARRLKPFLDKDYLYPFRNIKNIFIDSDIVFGNLETPLIYSNNIQNIKKNGRKQIFLLSNESFAQGLKWAGFNIVSLANNHSLDYGQEGLIQTMEILDKNNISYCGIWKGDLSLANKPLIRNINDTNIGFLCYSAVSPKSFAADIDKYGTVPAVIPVIKKDIKNAKKICDVLIVYLHWGKEYKPVRKIQYNMARKIIDIGADLLISSHTHLFQDIEYYKGKYIFYGLGNFIFDMRRENTKYSAIVKVFIKNKKIDKVKLIPIYIKNYAPELIDDSTKKESFFEKINLINLNINDLL